jgi:hypothetical protein
MYFEMNLFAKMLSILKSYMFNQGKSPTSNSMCLHDLLACFHN